MNDSKKYPWLRVLILVSLCPALVGFCALVYGVPLMISNRVEGVLFWVTMPLMIILYIFLAIYISALMYSLPMMLVASIVIAFKLTKTLANLLLVSVLGGSAALYWCRLMIYLDDGPRDEGRLFQITDMYRNGLKDFNIPVMTDGVVFLLGAVCSVVAAWLALPRRV